MNLNTAIFIDLLYIVSLKLEHRYHSCQAWYKEIKKIVNTIDSTISVSLFVEIEKGANIFFDVSSIVTKEQSTSYVLVCRLKTRLLVV